MTFADIRAMRPVHEKVHESVMRSYHVVQKVDELLAENVPHSVIREIIKDLMGAPDIPGMLDRE